jgi:hypothetical protein
MKMSCSVWKVLLASIIAGLVVFMWAWVSNGMLGWWNVKTFKDSVAVTKVIKANASLSGIYVIPAPMNAKPVKFSVISAVSFRSTHSMPLAMAIEALVRILCAFLIGLILSFLVKTTFWGRVLVVLLIAFFAAVGTQIPLWNWYGYTRMHTLVAICDTLIAWLLGGIILSAMIKPKKG